MPLSEREKATLAAYEIFETDAGKMVLADLEKAFLDLSYLPGAMDYKSGAAEVVLRIRATVEKAKRPIEEGPKKEEPIDV